MNHALPGMDRREFASPGFPEGTYESWISSKRRVAKIAEKNAEVPSSGIHTPENYTALMDQTPIPSAKSSAFSAFSAPPRFDPAIPWKSQPGKAGTNKGQTGSRKLEGCTHLFLHSCIPHSK
jgi:hypothetical protein